MEIHELLKEYRSTLGLNQKQMSGGVVSTSFYSRVEQGVSRISANDLLQILKLHNINTVDFFSQITVNTSEESVDEAKLINDLFIAFYNNDLSKVENLKNMMAQSSLSYQNAKLYAMLVEAALCHDPSMIDKESRIAIKKNIFNNMNWTVTNLKLFVNSMAIYDIDELVFLIHIILKKYKNSDNDKIQKIVASICVNFLDLSYKRQDLNFWKEVFTFLDNLPDTPDLFMLKLLGKYYLAISNGNIDTLSQIKHILSIAGYNKYIELLPKS